MRLVLALLAVVTLAGCAPQRIEDLLVPCPALVLPADLADLSRYQPGAQPDLSTLIFDARVTAVEGTCRRGRRDQSVEATLALRFRLDRGPAAAGRGFQLPWFLALLDSQTDAVVSRQSFNMPGQFSVNTTSANVTSQPVEISFPLGQGRRVQDFRVLVGFQLTEEELALNRSRGPR